MKVRRFNIRMALKNEIREAEVRARKRGDAWEAQLYLLPRAGANPLLAHEEKLGAPVLFPVDSEEVAVEEMMNHLERYFRLEIDEEPSGKTADPQKVKNSPKVS